jgi:ABC-type Mn2+/Zn2+ transport system permease subunit
LGLLVDPFLNNEFLLRALLAGALVSISCAVVGTFVVLRGLAFIGDALAHGVLPGIAAALLLGLPGMIGATVGALAMIGGVALISRRSRLSTDTAIGLLFVAMLALGVVIVSRSTSFAGDLVGILFGQILGTSLQGLAIQVVATLVVISAAVVFARPFLLLSFDAEQADVAGFPSRRYHALMLVLVALTVIVSFQTVGTLLVFGMLLAPAGAGALLANRIGTMMLIGSLIGSTASYVGLLLSYYLDLAAGAAMVLVATGIFFVVFVATSLREPRRTWTPGESEDREPGRAADREPAR